MCCKQSVTIINYQAGVYSLDSGISLQFHLLLNIFLSKNKRTPIAGQCSLLKCVFGLKEGVNPKSDEWQSSALEGRWGHISPFKLTLTLYMTDCLYLAPGHTLALYERACEHLQALPVCLFDFSQNSHSNDFCGTKGKHMFYTVFS